MKQETPKKQQKLVVGCIIKIDAFEYVYFGTIRDFAKRHGLQKNGMVPSGYGEFEYDPKSDSSNHLQVRAVYKYEGKHYYIPSSFSFLGDVSPKRRYEFISKPMNDITELDREICEKVCPGFLD